MNQQTLDQFAERLRQQVAKAMGVPSEMLGESKILADLIRKEVEDVRLIGTAASLLMRTGWMCQVIQDGENANATITRGKTVLVGRASTSLEAFNAALEAGGGMAELMEGGLA